MENNFRKAPKLYHSGSKGSGLFYQLPHNIMDAVFSKLDGKNGNAIKLMVVLLGTRGDGSFGISEEFIRQRTGMAKQNYHRTLHMLEEIGFVTLGEKSITVNIQNILNSHHDDDSTHDDDSQGNHHAKQSNHDDDSVGNHDDDYNKKEYINNKKIINKDSFSLREGSSQQADNCNKKDYFELYAPQPKRDTKPRRRGLEELEALWDVDDDEI